MLCALLQVGHTQPHALHGEPTRDTHAPRTPAAEHSLASQEPQYAGTMSFTASATTLHPIITAPLRMPSAKRHTGSGRARSMLRKAMALHRAENYLQPVQTASTWLRGIALT